MYVLRDVFFSLYFVSLEVSSAGNPHDYNFNFIESDHITNYKAIDCFVTQICIEDSIFPGNFLIAESILDNSLTNNDWQIDFFRHCLQ